MLNSKKLGFNEILFQATAGHDLFYKSDLYPNCTLRSKETFIDVLAKGKEYSDKYGMRFGDAYALYGKYIGNWGDKATVYRFEAVRDGKVVRTVSKTPFGSLSLKAVPSGTELTEGETYDVAAVRIEMTDQNGNRLPFFNEAVTADIRYASKFVTREDAENAAKLFKSLRKTEHFTEIAEIEIE